MTQRVIVSVIAIPVIFSIILFTPPVVLGILMGLVAARCVWEFLYCTEREAPLRVSVYAALSAFCLPFFSSLFDPGIVTAVCCFALFALMSLELMWSFRKKTTMEFETVAVTLMAGVAIPLLLSGVVRLATRENGGVSALFVFLIVFSCDIFAYLVGVAVGRHRLAPRISPNKTVEGCAGGLLASIGVALVYGVILRGFHFEVNLSALGACAFLGALAGQLGDLSFSAVKRLFGVKDFSRLIPGHGGMMDRFDSMVWAAPLMEMILIWVPVIVKFAEQAE